MKKIAIALLLAFGASPMALPAQAATVGHGVPACTGGEDISDDSDSYLMRLRGNGVKATRVEEWNGCIRAFVTEPNGHEAMQFFDPETLQQVGSAG